MPLTTLPAALAAMAQYPQFVLYRLQPSATKSGKMDKLPVDRAAYKAAWYQKNKERIYAAAKEKYQQNAEAAAALKKYKSEWYQKNKARLSEEYAARYAQNKDEIKAKKNARYPRRRDSILAYERARYSSLSEEQKRALFKRNSERERNRIDRTSLKAKASARRKRTREATPKWLTKMQRREIREIYAVAIMRSESTGERYQVDHIVPLRGKTVCGLHVPWNLQILTASENAKKGNRLPQNVGFTL